MRVAHIAVLQTIEARQNQLRSDLNRDTSVRLYVRTNNLVRLQIG